MGPLDASIVYINLPSIAHAFKADAASVGWVSMAYLLVMGSLLLSFGRLGDIFGFKRIYLLGLILFTGASVLCGFSGSLSQLIAFRALQALGAGMSLSLAPSIITDVFPASERGRALGINGMLVAVGLAAGPSLGGIIAENWGWRSIFFVNLPIGIIAFLWTQKVMPPYPRRTHTAFDWQGAALAFASLTALLLFADRIAKATRFAPGIFFLGLGALFFCTAFIKWERQTSEPMLDLTLFQHPVFSAGNAAALLNFMTQYILVFATPFLLQQQLQHTPGEAGTIMTAFPLTVLVTAPLAGYLSDRIGSAGLSAAGSLFCTIAAGGLALLTFGNEKSALPLLLSLFGLGTGLFQSPNNSSVMGTVPKHRLGIAGGVMATTRNVGMVLGIAAGSAVLTRSNSFPATYLTAAVISFLATAICFFAGRFASQNSKPPG